jgi:hypothetical protein
MWLPSLSLTHTQVYNEKRYDVLRQTSWGQALSASEELLSVDKEGLLQRQIKSEAEVLELLDQCQTVRSTSSTARNVKSSRLVSGCCTHPFIASLHQTFLHFSSTLFRQGLVVFLLIGAY